MCGKGGMHGVEGACVAKGMCMAKRGMHGKVWVCMAKGVSVAKVAHAWQRVDMHGEGGMHGGGVPSKWAMCGDRRHA